MGLPRTIGYSILLCNENAGQSVNLEIMGSNSLFRVNSVFRGNSVFMLWVYPESSLGLLFCHKFAPLRRIQFG